MTTRVVTGAVLDPNGDPYTGNVLFELLSPFTTGDAVYPAKVATVAIDSNGAIDTELAVPDEGTALYRITLPDNSSYLVYLAAGAATTLQALITIAGSSVDQDALQTLLDAHEADENAHTELASLSITDSVGFYGTTPIAKQTGVAVTAEAIHAALVALGLIEGV